MRDGQWARTLRPGNRRKHFRLAARTLRVGHVGFLLADSLIGHRARNALLDNGLVSNLGTTGNTLPSASCAKIEKKLPLRRLANRILYTGCLIGLQGCAGGITAARWPTSVPSHRQPASIDATPRLTMDQTTARTAYRRRGTATPTRHARE